jgi:hypothetical protein
MYRRQYREINNSLRKTKKAIIGIGCSFVQGQGALTDGLLQKYPWEVLPAGRMVAKYTEEQKNEIANEYGLFETAGELDFTYMEYENSFVNTLCNKHLNGEYTPINFGMRGNGNRASIKQLYLHPEIDWEFAEEIIVLYMPSGIERFDFALKDFDDHFNFVTMWPNYADPSVTGDRKKLWEGYAKTVWGEPHEVLEQIINAQELVSWCQNKNAKLITLLGFDPRYSREHFLTALTEHSAPKMRDWVERIVEQFPWNSMIDVGEYKMFIEYVMDQEKIPWETYWSYRGNGTPNNWLTPCCHPSAKAHDGYAKLISAELKNRGIL